MLLLKRTGSSTGKCKRFAFCLTVSVQLFATGNWLFAFSILHSTHFNVCNYITCNYLKYVTWVGEKRSTVGGKKKRWMNEIVQKILILSKMYEIYLIVGFYRFSYSRHGHWNPDGRQVVNESQENTKNIFQSQNLSMF